jgi:hypothetical protein
LNPIIGNSQRLSGFIARWKQPSPTSHDLLVRPTIGDLLVEPKQHVEMIIHHREAADGDCEDLCQFSIQPLRSCGPSPSKKARRTQREMQCYQRATVVSINCERAIAIG